MGCDRDNEILMFESWPTVCTAKEEIENIRKELEDMKKGKLKFEHKFV